VKIDLKTILIVVLGVALLLTNTCSRESKKGNNGTIEIGGKKYDVLETKSDTQYIPKEKIVIKPGKTIYKDTTIFLIAPLSVDTMEILKKYFSLNVFKDTLFLDDSLGYVSVIDTIEENYLKHRTWYSMVNKITVSNITIVKDPPKNQFFIGFNTTLNKSDIVGSFGLNTTYKTKKDVLYNVGTGLMNTNNDVLPYVGVGVQWKVKLKK
jgi:hypothetical protein